MRPALTCLLAATLALLCSAGSAGAARRKLTLYSRATAVQYINNADDAARGARNNPLDAAQNRLQPKVNRSGDGPFPGDVAVYSFDLYTTASLKASAGAASFTCYYNYKAHALCMAYFELGGGSGTITASGPIDFDKSGFKLVVTGGTKRYLGDTGQMTAIASPKNAQRLDFVLLDR